MNIFYFSYFSPPLLNVGANRSRRFSEALTGLGHRVEVFRESRDHRFANVDNKNKIELLADIVPVSSWNIDWSWKWPTIIHKQCYRLRHWRSPERDGDIAKNYWLIDLHWGWILPALYKAWHKSKVIKPDVIVVSCPPFSSALIGMLLSKWLNVPLVLDFRDGWSQASYFSDESYVKWEQKIMSQASALMVTSIADYHTYQSLYPQHCVRYIPNSYDQVLDHVSDNHNVLTLGYCGTWDGFRRSAKGLLKQLALCDLPIRLINIGDVQDEMMQLIRDYKLTDKVEMIGAQPKETLHDILSQCDVLFIQKGKPDKGKTDTHLATKAIDYVASGKPILAELPEGETLEFLRRHATQLYEVSIDEPFIYSQKLKQLHQLFEFSQLSIKTPSSDFYYQYGREKLTSDFIQVLTDVTTSRFTERVKT
ncbi:glycosyltransferase [Photobacterium angustum]|uniref:glycosyltransferase n=1 Tax=Photobacterium angustum TaxID=661 RepID=UPI0005DE5C56|nr:glycosyltransferase [Photobacterium angustum]KJG15700.1 hypothetical protein UA33_18120 [Photobacterium angustum]KJG24149.1 hypothetical protein UA39_08245 [Photobacterium angustum]KJG31752.1 hypothetical protein UA36_08380 [Photobacterium angustum]PSW96707.1 hypothetical protein C0W79_00120 [Photobacterium angustum]PSX03888.1 hypothetical protein C0W87_04115 [Photobacterium angustum]